MWLLRVMIFCAYDVPTTVALATWRSRMVKELLAKMISHKKKMICSPSHIKIPLLGLRPSRRVDT